MALNVVCRSLAVSAVFVVVSAVSGEAAEPAGAAFRFAPVSDKSLGLWEGEQPVLVYNHGKITPPGSTGGRGRACYFHPVYGLDGEVLTDDFPKDHTYHRGMYFAWPHIKLGDKEYELWTARGELQQVFQRLITQKSDERGAELGLENAWTIAGKPVVKEEIDLRVHPRAGESRSIDVVATWTPLTEPLTLSGAEGKSYGGFNVRFGPRVRPAITVSSETDLPVGVASSGGRVSDDLVMTKLAWADLTSEFVGSKGASGAAIFVHPRHRDFPPTWMTRHYGLVSVGWPGVEPRTFPVGKPITCRYRVWIHGGKRPAEEIESAYNSWRASELAASP